jgi:hypothetical protein
MNGIWFSRPWVLYVTLHGSKICLSIRIYIIPLHVIISHGKLQLKYSKYKTRKQKSHYHPIAVNIHDSHLGNR